MRRYITAFVLVFSFLLCSSITPIHSTSTASETFSNSAAIDQGTDPVPAGLHTNGTKILNAANQEVVFFGIMNIGTFQYPNYEPWYRDGQPKQSFFPADVQKIRSYGMNFIRLDFIIDNLFFNQPKPATPTTPTYSSLTWSRLDALIDEAERQGVWIAITNNCQPATQPLSSWFDPEVGDLPSWCFDGTWSYQPVAYPQTPAGDDQAVKDLFNLGNNKLANVRTLFYQVWKDIAARYKNRGHVLLSIFNEPFMDRTFWSSSSEMYQYATYYRDFCEATIDAIRQGESDGFNHIVIINNAYFYLDGMGGDWTVHVELNYGQYSPRRTNVVRDHHIYANFFGGSNTIPVVQRRLANYAWGDNVPIMWGEYGLYEEGTSESMTQAQIAEFLQTANTLTKNDGTVQPVSTVYCNYNSDPNNGHGMITPFAITWQTLVANKYPNLIYFSAET